MELTKQQQKIAEQIANGLSVAETGQILGISPNTVEAHLKLARSKNGAKNITHLIAMAFRNKLIK